MEKLNNLNQKTNQEKVPGKIKQVQYKLLPPTDKRDWGKVLLGVLVILLGAFYLLKNFGLLPAGINLNLWQLWPILIVVIGLSLLSRRNWSNIGAGAIVTLIILAIIALIFWSGAYDLTKDVADRDINLALAPNADKTEVRLDLGAVELDIEGVTAALLNGEVRSSGGDLSVSDSVLDGTHKAEVNLSSDLFSLFGKKVNQVDLALNNTLPMELYLQSKQSDLNLDLSNYHITYAEIETGASTFDLILGDKVARAEYKIKTGASTIDIETPLNAGVRVTLQGKMVSRDLEGFVKVDNNTFVSSNYEEAEKFIELHIDMGVSGLSIKQVALPEVREQIKAEQETCKNYDFKYYRTEDIYQGNININYNQFQHPEMYRQELEQIKSNGINFAGQYIIAGMPCGDNCRKNAIVNAKTGELITENLFSYYGIQFRPDSRLIIINYEQGKFPAGTLVNKRLQEMQTEYYEIKDNKLEMVCHKPFLKTIEIK